MLRQASIVAAKELLEGMRDRRSLLSSLMYAWMGPAVICLVSFGMKGDSSAVLSGMVSVFALVAAFTGGMAVAMDVLAGERERRSLLPLLINPLSRREAIAGKWAAICVFALAGVVFNAAGFGAAFAVAGIRPGGSAWGLAIVMLLGMAPMALFGAALELAISTVCRTLKEVHTNLSFLMFLPMGAGMFLVFYPRAAGGWLRLLPVIGQQFELEQWLRGNSVHWGDALLTGMATAICAGLVLLEAARRLRRDEVIYGE